MKRCGHWLSLLWVAVTLMCPQMQASASVSRDGATTRLNHFQERPLPLISDFTLSDIKKSEDKTDGPDRQQAEPMLGAPTITRQRPIVQVCGQVSAIGTAVRCTAAIDRPLICGPPALA
jgi:hypothetical protein